jgi:hypothetical protein
MPVPSGRPENVVVVLRQAFADEFVWPSGTNNRDLHYQSLATHYGYVARMSAGYVLTDLGRYEISRF